MYVREKERARARESESERESERKKERVRARERAREREGHWGSIAIGRGIYMGGSYRRSIGNPRTPMDPYGPLWSS